MTVEQPIGIFDSGIGGLTVARAVTDRLPQENIIYFGDTLHLPYGEKSTAAIQAYVVRIAQLFLEQNCKLILMACYSASTAAYELIREYVDGKAIVLNVIDPVVEWIGKQYAGQTVGLIGTRQTINSQLFPKKIAQLNQNIQLKQRATPLLAAAIEEQFKNSRIIDELIAEYLSHPDLADINALILGCTHYPIIKQRISQFYDHRVNIIDTSDIVAKKVHDVLEAHRLLNVSDAGEKYFYVSDYTDSFLKSAQFFFNGEIKLKHAGLW